MMPRHNLVAVTVGLSRELCTNKQERYISYLHVNLLDYNDLIFRLINLFEYLMKCFNLLKLKHSNFFHEMIMALLKPV